MTADDKLPEERRPGHAGRPVWDCIRDAAQSTPLRMPAGGWLREVATSENWRTTTIVQRHRDRASATHGS